MLLVTGARRGRVTQLATRLWIELLREQLARTLDDGVVCSER